MNQILNSARCLPLIIFAMMSGTVLIVANPGLFWDDWVWFYNDPAERIRIGQELGIWWGGYLSNAIYSLNYPILSLRLVSLLAWISSGAALSFVLYRRKYISGSDALFIFVLYCACHVGLIRFVNSVAMYNVYIASFWIGCAILVCDVNSRLARLMSMPFFFFSFHLNSIVLFYALVLSLLFWETMSKRIANRLNISMSASEVVRSISTRTWEIVRSISMRVREIIRSGEYQQELVSSYKVVRNISMRAWEIIRGGTYRQELVSSYKQAARSVWSDVLIFCRQNLDLVLLPLAFLVLIKAPSLIIARLSGTHTNLYNNYNSPFEIGFFKAIYLSYKEIPGLLYSYFELAWTSTPSRFIFIFSAIYFILILLLPKASAWPRWQSALGQLVLGWLLIIVGLYPYALVNKLPRVMDFYESRHILTAVPGLVVFLIAGANLLCALTSPSFPRGAVLFRNAVLAFMLGLSSSYSFVFGFELLKDWIRQEAIVAYIRQNKNDLADFKTFVFFDETQKFKIRERYIWNYEYTGNLLSVFGSKDRFGISTNEYIGLPKHAALLNDPTQRKRFNIENYDVRAPHAILSIRNNDEYPEIRGKDVLDIAGRYWRGKTFDNEVLSFFEFKFAVEYTEIEERIVDMRLIIAALEAYKQDHGFYPHTGPDPGKLLGTTFVPKKIISLMGKSPPSTEEWLEGFSPEYISMKLLFPICRNPGCRYQYISDGLDYKLVWLDPLDLAYAKQAYSWMINPVRNGYGLWTKNAERW